jgi:hypothetical protein
LLHVLNDVIGSLKSVILGKSCGAFESYTCWLFFSVLQFFNSFHVLLVSLSR